MALLRLGCSKKLPAILTRFNHAVTVPLGDVQTLGKIMEPRRLEITKPAKFHVSGIRRYPEAPRLPLPTNVSQIFSNETGRFTPERVRDMAMSTMMYGSGSGSRLSYEKSWSSSSARKFGDSHVDSYDCFGAISLNSSMQTNVPKPFSSTGKSSYLNMPGSQWAQDGKYIAESMRKSHYVVFKDRKGRGESLSMRTQCYSTESNVGKSDADPPAKLSNGQKLKRAVKDYGSTVIVFHVSISLISLGFFYAVVSSGLDITSLVKMIPGSSERLESVMTNSSTFLVAYAIHKILAPVRISITLGATPFIVNYLRRAGILKMKTTKT